MVDRLAGGDPQDPPVKTFTVIQAWVRPQRGDERLLEAVIRLERTHRHP
jgi:hypothetical protein